MKGEQMKILKETLVVYLKILSQHLS